MIRLPSVQVVAFSRMCSKGSRFTLGVWGLRVCSLDVAFTSATARNRPQIRNHPREGRMAVPMVRSAKGVTFGGLKRSHCFVSHGKRGTSWHSDVFRTVTCGKSFCVASAILLRRLQKMRCIFRGRRRTLDVPIVILRGRRSTLEESCCVSSAVAVSAGCNVVLRRRGTSWHFSRVCKFLCDRRNTFH